MMCFTPGPVTDRSVCRSQAPLPHTADSRWKHAMDLFMQTAVQKAAIPPQKCLNAPPVRLISWAVLKANTKQPSALWNHLLSVLCVQNWTSSDERECCRTSPGQSKAGSAGSVCPRPFQLTPELSSLTLPRCWPSYRIQRPSRLENLQCYETMSETTDWI